MLGTGRRLKLKWGSPCSHDVHQGARYSARAASNIAPAVPACSTGALEASARARTRRSTPNAGRSPAFPRAASRSSPARPRPPLLFLSFERQRARKLEGLQPTPPAGCRRRCSNGFPGSGLSPPPSVGGTIRFACSGEKKKGSPPLPPGGCPHSWETYSCQVMRITQKYFKEDVRGRSRGMGVTAPTTPSEIECRI